MIREFLRRRKLIKKSKEMRSSGLICRFCKIYIPLKDLEENACTCPSCHGLLDMTADQRLEFFFDSYKDITDSYVFRNPISYPDYDKKIRREQEKSKIDEAIKIAEAELRGHKLMVGVMDKRFMMASMGSFVGEELTRLFEIASEKRLPVFIFSASGGARMQEGIISLMQMVKINFAVANHSKKGLLYVNIMTHPTTGGVTASFASVADIILAEEGALIGFAGKRVIQSTISEKLPDDFQSAESVLKNGFLDGIYKRRELRDKLADILDLHEVNHAG